MGFLFGAQPAQIVVPRPRLIHLADGLFVPPAGLRLATESPVRHG
jgi:hypothetical protein